MFRAARVCSDRMQQNAVNLNTAVLAQEWLRVEPAAEFEADCFNQRQGLVGAANAEKAAFCLVGGMKNRTTRERRRTHGWIFLNRFGGVFPAESFR